MNNITTINREMQVFKEHGTFQKRQLQRIIDRDVSQLKKLERVVIHRVKMDVASVIKTFEEKLDMKEQEDE